MPGWFIWLRNLAGGLILMAWLLVVVVQRRYIIRRYEQQSSLSKLKVFQNPLLFSFKPGLRTFVKQVVYTMHLFVVSAFPTALRQQLSTFDDLPKRSEVLSTFSKFEIAVTVVIGLAGTVGLALAIAAFVLRPFI